jgi:hypothetical protein
MTPWLPYFKTFVQYLVFYLFNFVRPAEVGGGAILYSFQLFSTVTFNVTQRLRCGGEFSKGIFNVIWQIGGGEGGAAKISILNFLFYFTDAAESLRG